MITKKVLKLTRILLAVVLLSYSCVHDDDYSTPTIADCTDLVSNITLGQLKSMFQGGDEIRITDDLIVEGYVVSSDEQGNIYKNLFIQDHPTNPTHGFTLSVDAADLYTKYPIGYKVFIKLKDLWLGEYGDVVQLGDISLDAETEDFEFGRIPSYKVDTHIFLGCTYEEIVPKTVTTNLFNDDLIGALIQLENVEISSAYICEPYSYPELTQNRNIKDCSGNTVTLRNSGYSNFTNEIMPAGNGNMTAILSKFGSTYQLFVRDTNDMAAMTNARCDGTVVDCTPPAVTSTIQEVKDLYSGGLTQITQDIVIDGVVTANDDTGNLYKLIYIEDETGGLRVRLNKTNLYFNPKYYVGSKIIVKAKDLYIDDSNGELHLGGLYNGNIGNIEADEIYKHIFSTQTTETVTPTTLTFTDLAAAELGKLVKFENVEFIDNDVDQPYAGNFATNRTLQDCNGNNLVVRTSNYASFASNSIPGGNGDITGILSIYNGTYQLWLRYPTEVNMTDVRCDGSVPATTVFSDDFASLGNWTAHNITGAQVWDNPNFGNPAPCARMSGYSGGAMENEDWLVSNDIDLTGFSTATFSFDNVKRYSGNDIEAYYSTDYAGSVAAATWVTLAPTLDTNTGSWSSWTNSGSLDISAAVGGQVVVAFKYTSTTSASATWEIDNVKVKATN